ncbi:hypothetical protein BS50DRAFT_572505 [Corynespora cassiicola Philippines]|uniref:Uncharacterized protein n=1 Tax=Corynespora cassiicola Philippines TaxID=1448308 RepID=A0A2T2NV94_CORCC|nr:hypothetical protein BS50DRAFT_572505 [Corynespora cassiicola Philippines]
MVDQNANAPTPLSSSSSETSPTPHPQNKLSTPTVVRAGEMMLIFSLVLIFSVCFFVALHFYLKRRKRHRKPKNKKDKKIKRKSIQGQSELDAERKEVAELVGTPICEMGDSEPRHEMEDAEVHERYTTLEAPSPAHLEAGDTLQRSNSQTVEPDARQYSIYWSARL